MTRVGVLGAGGRMGREVCRAIADDPDLELVALRWQGSTCAR
jgi:dihydrodipicolinate reductase